jgi:hypothetical protein
MLNKEFFQDKKFFMPNESYLPFLNPFFDKDKYIYKKMQRLLFKQFINPEINAYKLMNEVGIKIFNPPDNINNETNEDYNKIYLINQKREKNELLNDRILAPKINQKEEKIIIEIDTLIEKTKNDLKSGKLQFISRKRKNPKNNPDEFGDSQTSENSEILCNKMNSVYNYRLDYYKKAFKAKFIKSLTVFLNNLIRKCNLPKEFKIGKIFKPNNLSFTANVNDEDNFEFLNKSLAYIYCYIKGNKSDGASLQKKNKEFIEKILNFNPKIENEALKTLKIYLKMKLEDYIKLYYKTNDFKIFSKEEKIQFYEKEFIKEKKFPLLQDNGYIKLVKINSKKDFSYGLKSIH